MTPPPEILDLITRFERNIDSYRSPAYNEAQLRLEFLNPFFQALGWDVYNTQGHAEAYKEVIHEDAIKIGAPDYCFRIGGTRKFFVEAKKPSVRILADGPLRDDTPAYQLRRYAWSAKLPLSILTDFEEFAIYDCRIRPRETDKISTARIFCCTYQEYPEKWGKIAPIFSRDAILRGDFDRHAESKGKRGTSQVDAEFLKEIEEWRELLAKNIALRNPGLSVRDLNFSVQHTIDRIIFLRMAEDRGIEPYGQLQALLNGAEIYPRLRVLYDRADERYNSGLFHFQKEKGREEKPDELTPRLIIEDKVLKHIIKRLYYPESPYEFSVIGGDILGNVYEQFLGKVIRLVGKSARVEEKPEVKKAGGVYYTPGYIVDYIVKNTVGKLVDGKTPKDVAKLKILDPACGSGSFLIGAYTFLLDWHRDEYYKDGPDKHTKEIYQGAGGMWHLATRKKKEILLNNIYGVDIDSQAVEVTKLNLLLKLLEGENQNTIERQFKLFHERALPDLASNIKCGNSLIGPDFYELHQLGLFDDEERYRINVFDWNSAFPKIMKAGGFDAVIGNPPYVRIQALKEWAPVEVEHYKKAYTSAGKGNYDIYVAMIQRGLNLLSGDGRLGFIVSSKFMKSNYGEPIREYISTGKHLSEVVIFGDNQVFEGATTYTSLLFLSKKPNNDIRVIAVKDLAAWRAGSENNEDTIPNDAIDSREWNFVVGKHAQLVRRLQAMAQKLGDICQIFVGLQTSADTVFILDVQRRNTRLVRALSPSLKREIELESSICRPLLSGQDVNRYGTPIERQAIIFPYFVENEQAELISEKDLKSSFPLAWEYLLENRKVLEQRERGKFKGRHWYRFGRSQNLGIQNREKLCIPRLVSPLHATIDFGGKWFLDNVDVNGVTILNDYQDLDYRYLLGLINSKLSAWYFPYISAPFRGGYYSANRQFISQLPIRQIDFSSPKDKEYHDKIVSLVQTMLDLSKKLHSANTPSEKTMLQRQIDATDLQIDKLVYELYGLTDEEIEIVEQG